MKKCLCEKLSTPVAWILGFIGLFTVLLFIHLTSGIMNFVTTYRVPWILGIIALFTVFLLIHRRSGIVNFFTTYRDVFTGVGYSAVAFSLILTYAQIKRSNDLAKASLSYNLMKESVRMSSSIEHNILEIMLEDSEAEISDTEDKKKVERAIENMFRFYAEVSLQRQYKIIDRKEYEAYLTNFCRLLKRPRIKRHWKDRVLNNPTWPEVFMKMERQCHQ